MPDTIAPSAEVLLILDPDFGERLRDAWQGQAIWIAMSATNAPIVQPLWAVASNANYLCGITGFTHGDSGTAEESFLDIVSDIDLHHGPYSTANPYTVLRVIGTPFTPAIREALSELGFFAFQQNPDGFTANRSEDQAKRLQR